jgi:hypothetical protein
MAGTTSEILKRITQRAQDCLALPSISTLSHSFKFPPQSCSPRRPIDITLPDPPPIQPALIAAGAHLDISLAMDQEYQKRAAELRVFCRSAAANVCSNQAQYPSKFRYVSEQKIMSVFTELYLKQLVTWRDDCVALYLKHSTAGDKPQPSIGTPKFNYVRLVSCLCLSSLV